MILIRVANVGGAPSLQGAIVEGDAVTHYLHTRGPPPGSDEDQEEAGNDSPGIAPMLEYRL